MSEVHTRPRYDVSLWPPEDGGDTWVVKVTEPAAVSEHRVQGYDAARARAIKEGKAVGVTPWVPGIDGQPRDLFDEDDLGPTAYDAAKEIIDRFKSRDGFLVTASAGLECVFVYPRREPDYKEQAECRKIAGRFPVIFRNVGEIGSR